MKEARVKGSIVAKYELSRVASHRFTAESAKQYNEAAARNGIPSVVEGQVHVHRDARGRVILRPVEVRIHYRGDQIRVACNRAVRWLRSGRTYDQAPHHIRMALQVLRQVAA